MPKFLPEVSMKSVKFSTDDSVIGTEPSDDDHSQERYDKKLLKKKVSRY